jgi:DHA1 family tetracycline resistance protein-like MFS transporter
MTTIVDPHSLAPTPARLGPRSAFNGSHTTGSARSEAQRLRRTSKIAKLKKSSPVESFYSRLEKRPVTDEKPRGKPLLVILSVVFLDLVGIGILIPVVPILLAGPRSPFYLLPAGYTIQTGYILLGWLVAIYPLCQFLAAPVLGQLSDRYGRRRLLGISVTGTCISYIIFAFGIVTRNIRLLFLARGFDGITGGNIPVAQAVIADITPPEQRAKNFGLLGAAFGLGFIISPYIGGKLSDPSLVSWFTAATPFWFAALLSAMNVVLILFLLPETLARAQRGLKIQWSRSLRDVAHAYIYKDFRALFATVFLFQGGFTFYTTFIGV